jgi:hypothetical protein
MHLTHRFGRRLALPSTLQVMHELRRMKLSGAVLPITDINERTLERQTSRLNNLSREDSTIVT